MSVFRKNEQAVQDKAADHYELLRYSIPYSRYYHDWWIRQMLSLTHHEKRAGTVLDNGCGTGIVFEHFSCGQAVFGLDLSLGMLAKARKHDCRLIQSDSLSLPFPDETFDLVIARSLLHHLPNLETGILEMNRVLKPSGQIVLADTNNSVLSNLPRTIAYRRENFSSEHSNLNRKEYLSCLSGYFHLDCVQFFGYFAYPFGFPDLMGPFRHVPFPKILVQMLIGFDSILSTIPGVKTQSWGIIVAGTKR